MKTVDIENLQILKRFNFSGSLSKIHIVSYEGIEYCFKEFELTDLYPVQIIENISNLTEIKFDNYFLTPKFMVIQNDKIIGYLSLYYEKNKGLYNHDLNTGIYNIELNYKRKIDILKDARKKIQILHKKYNIIHGDLDIQNILFDNNNEVSIIDFDSALKYNQEIKSTITLSRVLYDYNNSYLDYFKYDYKADIYRFNLTTLKLLNNIISDEEIFWYIYRCSNESNDNVKKLMKELLLNPKEIKKEYSGEYIIDYL